VVNGARRALGIDQSHFPPIEDYAFLSDCETTALVAPDGAVEWMCLPRMDSPSVFGAVLDRDAGRFRIGPVSVDVPSARRYIPGTLVVETSWWTPGGWLVVTDALLMGPWHHENERSRTHRRAPTDYDAAHVLLRVVRWASVGRRFMVCADGRQPRSRHRARCGSGWRRRAWRAPAPRGRRPCGSRRPVGSPRPGTAAARG